MTLSVYLIGAPEESVTRFVVTCRVPALNRLVATSWPLSPREIRKLSTSVTAPPPREIRNAPSSTIAPWRVTPVPAAQPPVLKTIASPAQHLAAVMERTCVIEVTYPVETAWFIPLA